MMTHYGVRRLVVINSGKYLYANIDLSKPVHLAAPNNRGKSTLVNALQFLYIDDFNKMTFGGRTHEDTRRHYFGEDRSYLVFECLTATGIQCMLVRGLSNLRGGQFERYVYDGEFRDADYLDADEIRDFDSIRTCLADRHLARVKNSDLWQALAGNLPSDDGKPVPRLNILPIRRRDEYTAFRDVFVQLLSLKNADARQLRQLIIDSHAREVGERKIDVAAEYKDEFERVERSERAFNFIRSVADEIDNGRQLRQDIQALSDKFAAVAPLTWNDARRCHAFFGADENRLSADAARWEGEQKESQAKKESLLKNGGRLEAMRDAIAGEWKQLGDTHEKWSAYSADFIKGMRDNVQRKSVEIAELEQNLEQGSRLDLDAMRGRVAQLEQQIAFDRRAFEGWEQTAAAELRRAGVSDSELDSTFRIVNPALLKLIVGETVTIRDLNATLGRIRFVARRVKDGNYADESIEADISGVAGPDSECMRNIEQLRNRITLNEQELNQQRARLRTAEDREKARTTLGRLTKECEELRDNVAKYDAHTTAWSARAELEQRLANAKKDVVDVQDEIAKVERQLNTQIEEAKRVERELGSLNVQRDKLNSAAKAFREETRRLAVDALLPLASDNEVDDVARPRSLQRFVESVTSKLSALTADLCQIGTCRSQLKRLQEIIAAKSRDFETQQRYFSDEDSEWDSLIETRESLPQLEDATKKNWDALSTTLGARLNAIVAAVSSIKTAVERINRGLKAYQVSNLRAVQITVEVENDTYSAVEALSGQGSLFQDRDAVELAKKQLRQMIDRNVAIELQSLFELRIRIQEIDGTWHQARSLDDIGSTGTGMTAKAMIFIQLVRAIAGNENFRLHFYIDGLGDLDDRNLAAMAAMAVSKGIIPITADPRLHLESLAHPEVTVYSLGQDSDGRFYIDCYKTYHARRRTQSAELTRE